MNDNFPTSPSASRSFSATATATAAQAQAQATSVSHLPHHKLLAYTVSLELLAAVRAAAVRDATLRDHALRSAKSACLNAAEGAGRVTRPDKARAFAIARVEACEAAAAVEIDAATGEASGPGAVEVLRLADRVVALFTGLIR